MAFTIPEMLRFTCHCGAWYDLPAKCLSGRDTVFCPLCATETGWMDAIDPVLLREILVQAREEVDSLIDYLQANGGIGEAEMTPEVMQLILKEVIKARRTN
jgi:hypothetical protein